MAIKEKRAKQKRRSFNEPDAKELTTWLNNQKNLGISLQLIIVDAISKYGKGDAIETHLTRRIESFNATGQLNDFAPLKTNLEPDKEEDLKRVIVETKSKKSSPVKTVEEKKEDVPVDREIELPPKQEPIEIEEPEKTPEVSEKKKYNPIDAVLSNAESERQEAPRTKKDEDDEMLRIMMADADSEMG